MGWLRDVHLPTLPLQFESAVIYGNEDAPDRIDAYLDRDPAHDDQYLRYIAKGSGYTAEWIVPE
jgi:hypothetical protein